MGVLIFVIITCSIYILYGIISLFMLMRVRSEGESAEKFERVSELTHKVFQGALNFLKLDLLVAFTATIIFFMIIMV